MYQKPLAGFPARVLWVGVVLLRGVAVLIVALAPAFAGCAAPEVALPWEERLEGPPVAGAPWAVGSYWTYRATFENGRSIDVALVVHRAGPDGYVLGTNLTAGFFGLPFNGTVTRNLNPVIGDEEWRLFDFPLAAGKRWSYELSGHTVTTRVAGARLDLPEGGESAGFALETTAYGRTFATYTYCPTTGWFTRLTLHEPTDGRQVLDVVLTGSGEAYGQDYFVEVPVHRLRHEYPSLGGPDTFPLPATRLAATLALRGDAGAFDARLVSPRGATVLEAEVQGQGRAVERATFTGAPGAWRLEHVGLGQGALRLDVTAVLRADGGPAPDAPVAAVPSLALASLLR